jgi:hypothetical protein
MQKFNFILGYKIEMSFRNCQVNFCHV